MRLSRSLACVSLAALAAAASGTAGSAMAASPTARPAAAAPASAATVPNDGFLPPVSDLAKSRIEKMREPKKPGKPPKLVDINHASAAELKTLPGIGDAEARRIIAGRPYWSKAELVSKNVLPMGPYQSLRKQVVASQRGVAPPKRAASTGRGAA